MAMQQQPDAIEKAKSELMGAILFVTRQKIPAIAASAKKDTAKQ